jgi:DNA-binding GntR family transcriptional regulator
MKRSTVSEVRPVRRAASALEPAAGDAPSVLARRSDTTLTEQLTRRFAERIGQRLLAPGARLPSVRECARRHAVSPYTVVAA